MPDTGPGAIADLFVIGGGVNGCSIARDAAGRGLSVVLAEAGDLAQGTSSASTKLFHGGLRYLEYFEFRLVREALEERETLLRAMPHISWPMRFVLPWSAEMRFENETPASRLLARLMPWMRGRRPAWMIRFGLFLYDNMGGRKILPGTRRLDLRKDPAGRALKPGSRLAWEYSDCWVQDARLVVLNARDAEARGARILTRTRVVTARRASGFWQVETRDPNGRTAVHRARALVNVAGPWMKQVTGEVIHGSDPVAMRLVRGSHIVTRRLFEHDRCYFFQGPDGRIIFAIPYEQDFTLIGTTDQDHSGAPEDASCTAAERDYLCAFASRWFARPVTPEDVVWSYSGVRPLLDNGTGSAAAASRDYVLRLEGAAGEAPVLNIHGGKITTSRRLAESAMRALAAFFPQAGPAWTAGVALPGGNFPVDGVEDLTARLSLAYPFLTPASAQRMIRTYGTDAFAVLGDAKCPEDLGADFGASLTEAEVRWAMEREFARSAEDLLWRRTKLGLHLSSAQVATVEAFMAGMRDCAPAASPPE